LVTVIPIRHLPVLPGKKFPTKNLSRTLFPDPDILIKSLRFNSLSDLLKKNEILIDPRNLIYITVCQYFQAVNFCLPLALRLFTILRPALVDILFKKPCVLARLILLG